MNAPKHIGDPSLVNVDAPDKVSGRTRYIHDMMAPGALIAKVLRSPLPHARIAAIDVTPALAIPGVHAAITHADFVEDGAFGWPMRDATILATDKVRYVGEAIAAVAAETEAAAQAGIEAITISYEALPVVGSVDEAAAPDAPQVNTRAGSGEGNLCNTHLLRNGDPAPYLAEAPVTFEATYEMPHQEHAYLETEGAMAIPTPDGSVTVYANCQSPHINRDTMAQVLGLAQDQVRVIQPPIGGAFGGKDEVVYQTSAQAAKLALLSGRPVRLILSRSESLVASYKRQAMRSHILLGADEAGRLQAAKVHLMIDNGAYAAGTPLSSWRATMHAAGAYRYQAVHVDTEALYTNNGYAGAFRGFGNTQASAAVELAIDELATQLGRDPIAYRLENCLRAGDRTMTGDHL
jgi:nicotinate dehydrogenase large molybdopterin subunit